MKYENEYFGDSEKIALAKRSAHLWSLLKEDSRFAFQGRIVLLSEPGEDMVETMVAMAKLQGGAVCNYFPIDKAKQTITELQAHGLETVEHVHLRGDKSSLEASLKALDSYVLPEDLTITSFDETTPSGLVEEVVEMSERCGVTSVPGWVMRGAGPKGVYLVAQNQDGEPVACAASFMCHPESSSHADDAFWGMLATREDRRGQRIAFLLGAQAIVHMWNEHNARGFITGVSAENPSSMALCKKLGLSETEWQYISCVDKTIFARSSITK
ncbi:MAG: GNAT family N-acetyltransferase [Rhizobiaceae bacterium]